MRTKYKWLFLTLLIISELTAQEDTLRFGVITDIQYCNCESYGSRYFSNSLNKATKAVKILNTKNLSFTIHLGDLIDRDFQSYDSILPIVRKLSMPLYFAYGNHDYRVAENWKYSIDSIHRQAHSYYTFKVNNWRFITLNTNDISSYTYPQNSIEAIKSDSIIQVLKSQTNINIKPWNGGVGSIQLKWLQQCLETAKAQNEQVIVFGHHPLYPASSDNLLNYYELITLLEKYSCVKAYFCGHNHKGKFAQKKNIYYINQKGMVETKNGTAYSIVELTPNSMFIKGYGREKTRKIQIK